MAAYRGDDLLANPAFASLLDKDAQAPLKARYGTKERPAMLAAPEAVIAALVEAGYQLKDAPMDALAEAIRVVHGGGRATAPELALESWSGGEDPLTERERQVHLSEGTVRNYLSEAISKLGAANRVEAYRMARDAGWL